MVFLEPVFPSIPATLACITVDGRRGSAGHEGKKSSNTTIACARSYVVDICARHRTRARRERPHHTKWQRHLLQLLGVKDCEGTHAQPFHGVSLAWREPLIFRGSSSKGLLLALSHSSRSLASSPTIAVLLFFPSGPVTLPLVLR
jgi:hypothetical protein